MDTGEVSDLNTAFNNDQAEQLFDRSSTVEYSDEFKAAPAVSVKIDPGTTVWAKINQIVNETKFEVLYQDDVLFFGDLQKIRQSKIDFSIINQKDRIDALSTKFDEAITNRYSTINLFGQPEYNWTAANYFTNSGTATDSTLLHKKFYCAQSSGNLQNKAIKLREDQRYSGYQLSYILPGHLAPNGAVWKINRYVSVLDDFVGIGKQLVIYGRSFIFSQTAGTTTELTLSIERSNQKDL
jgi:prophage tail gpP-like protein